MTGLALLAIGDELLAGEVRDENGPFLLEAARRAGVSVVGVCLVPDDPVAVRDALAYWRPRAVAVVLSGGIGPTHDDPTRAAMAAFLGVPLERSTWAEARLRAIYGPDVHEAELSMADLPRGARPVEGDRTATFGFEAGGLFALPGVPRLFADVVPSVLAGLVRRPLSRRTIEVDRREGEVAERLAAVQAHSPDVAVGSYPLFEAGRWRLRIVVRGPNARRVEEVAAELEAVLAREA